MADTGKSPRKVTPEGSFVLDKQLARAAIGRKKVTFMVNLGSNHEVSGYITGMDSYTVMVVVPVAGQDTDETVGTRTMIVHKGSAAITMISDTETLDDEPDLIQKIVTEIGERFWQTCRERYLGHHTAGQERTS